MLASDASRLSGSVGSGRGRFLGWLPSVDASGSVLGLRLGRSSDCSSDCASDCGDAASTCWRRASTTRAVCDRGAANRLTAWLAEAFMAPASFDSSTSRDSRSASLAISAASSTRPESRPLRSTRALWALLKSRRPLAATTGSPLTKATADGPENSSTSASAPASLAARRARVFFTTV